MSQKTYRLVKLPDAKWGKEGQLPPSEGSYYAAHIHLFKPDATRFCGPKQWSSGKAYTHWLEEVPQPERVPITPEALEAAGWEPYAGYTLVRGKGKTRVAISFIGAEMRLMIGHWVNCPGCKYMDQLESLLKMLGVQP